MVEEIGGQWRCTMFVAGIVSKFELWEVATRRVKTRLPQIVASVTPWLGPTFTPPF
jgi:hypothetical protein